MMKKLLSLLFLSLFFTAQAQMTNLQSFCGSFTFDLTVMDNQLSGNNPLVLVSYHLSQSDAAANINPIIHPENFDASSSQMIIFARINNIDTGDISYHVFNLTVNPILNVTIGQTLNIPTSTLFAEVTGGTLLYTYAWSYNGTLLPNETGAQLQILNFPPGVFTLTVTDSSGCTNTVSIQANGGGINQTIIANDDAFTFTNLDGGITPPGIGNILFNDRVNSLPATTNNVSISLVSSTIPGISFDSEGGLLVDHQVPNGTYTILYQICELINPNNCDTATITLTVNSCRAETPVIDSIVMPTCSNTNGATVNLSGLPSVGTWDILLYTNTDLISYSGTGLTSSIPNLSAGTYYLTVRGEDILLGNCYESFPITFTITQQYGLTSDMTGTYVDLNTNGITDVGDTISYGFSVSNTACVEANDVILESNTINITGEMISVLPSNTTDTTTFTGTYVLTQQDINRGQVMNHTRLHGLYNEVPFTVNDSLSTSLNIPNGIKLNAFFDLNNNGVQDSNEQNFTGGSFSYQLNSGTPHSVFSSTGTFYLYETNPLNSYNISYILNPSYGCQFNYSLATASYSNVTVASGSGITTYNFAVTNTTSCLDLSVHLFNYGAPPRPGFTYQNQIVYTNDSNQTIASGTVTFRKDNLLTIVYPVPGSVSTADGFTYDFTNMNPHEVRSILVTMQVPTIPTIALGDFMTNSAAISLLPNDINTLNNIDTLRSVVVGSYDPNEKTESHGGKIAFSDFSADDYLTYTIRFENTGTAEAINIRVEDLLDEQLDETSIRMLRASHPYVLDRVGNALNWKFNGVNLPPSIDGDEITGHGYVIFQIKPKPGFALGDVIPNTASIYFDFNPAIVTEPCLTEFVNTLATNSFAFNQLKAYPNPTKNTFHISNDSVIDSITITSITGQTVMKKTVNTLQSEIDFSEVSNGLYFAKVTSQNQEKTIKIIKE